MSIRVSMGTIFSLPIVRSEDLPAELVKLRQQHGYDLVATVLDGTAEVLDRAARSFRQGILFGNEATGLEPDVVNACNRRVSLPMSRGTDSLNVAVAAGVFLYHFTRE
jgi:tRNA G18 (ribose-2'-O)-methylase SpoU